MWYDVAAILKSNMAAIWILNITTITLSYVIFFRMNSLVSECIHAELYIEFDL